MLPGTQFKEYLDRAEFIKGLLDGQQTVEPSAANGTVGQKVRPPGGGGGGGDKDVSFFCSSCLTLSRALACLMGLNGTLIFFLFCCTGV